MKSVFCAAAAACAAASWSQPASANIINFTYVGKVTAGEDLSGVFGSPFADLAGDKIKVVFKFNDSLGLRTTNAGVSDGVVGGSSLGLDTPSLGATITLNGVKVSVGGDYYAGVLNIAGKANGSTVYEDPNNFVLTAFASSNTPASLDTPFKVGGPGGGIFQIDTQDALGQPQFAFAQFTALPEPADWLLLVLGVGALGAALRRKARLADAAGAQA